MFKTIAIGVVVVLVVLLVGLLAFAATKPDAFRVQRTTSIKAPPEKILALINDFHSWVAWSPFENLDPAMKRTYSGPANGKGAVYEWEGNGKAGQGRMEISDVAPSSRVTIKLDFIKPFEAHNVAEFTLDDNGDSTNVTWAMHGPSPYFVKVMHTLFSMDRMVGGSFETGLANLKAVAEK
jgi:carbon monoxide dehydrogenase subunit G